MKRYLGWVLVVLIFTKISIGKNKESIILQIKPIIESQNVTAYIYSEASIMNAFASELFLNKGIAKLKEQEYEFAISNFNQAIRLNLGSYEAYKLLGEAKAACGLLSEAVQDFDLAININPFYTEAYLKKALLLQKTGNLKEAYYNYSLAMYIDPIYTYAFFQKDLDLISFYTITKKHQGLKIAKK